MMLDLTNWMMVFLRVSAMLSVFPVFSTANFPVQMRLALGALIAALIGPTLSPSVSLNGDFWGLIGVMAVEVGVGLMFGFATRMIFFALDIAGVIIGLAICARLLAQTAPRAGQYGIAYASFAPLNGEVFVADADGSHARPLSPDPGWDANASFSMDGQWVAFTSNRQGLTARSTITRGRQRTLRPMRCSASAKSASSRTAKPPVGSEIARRLFNIAAR